MAKRTARTRPSTNGKQPPPSAGLPGVPTARHEAILRRRADRAAEGRDEEERRANDHVRWLRFQEAISAARARRGDLGDHAAAVAEYLAAWPRPCDPCADRDALRRTALDNLSGLDPSVAKRWAVDGFEEEELYRSGVELLRGVLTTPPPPPADVRQCLAGWLGHTFGVEVVATAVRNLLEIIEPREDPATEPPAGGEAAADARRGEPPAEPPRTARWSAAEMTAELADIRRQLDDQQMARHSEDFCSVHWFGCDYTFSGTQAAAVKVMWSAWENGTPDLLGETILRAAESQSDYLSDLFKHHEAWGGMIVANPSVKGAYRLHAPQG